MSRVFEAMRRVSAATAESPAATAEVLEDFVLEGPRPSLDATHESPAPSSTLWNDPTLPAKNPPDHRPVREIKREKMARSFNDLLRAIARDEQEQDL